jgi:hypothetical protein
MLVLALISTAAHGQTYFGVLTSSPNAGPGGSCCSDVKTATASNVPVPTDGSCAGCSVITSAQASAYFAGAAALQPGMATNLLAAGVAMTFTSTTTANDHYAATDAAIQTLLNLQTGKVGIGAASTVTVPGISGPHVMGMPAFHDVYNAVSSYHDAVLAAQATALTNNTAPVFPVATATSSH